MLKITLSTKQITYRLSSSIYQEDTQVSESRPTTAPTPGPLDPLALEVEDLYAKYKVS